MKNLLVIFAHPDDESFGLGGTLAKYAREGVAVHYLCATRGEAGTVNGDFMGQYGSIGELRAAELERAADALGLASVRFLGYRDSGMPGSADQRHEKSLAAAPLDDVAQRIAHYVGTLRPDAVVTHDQYGWYGHPDHIKCYEATLRAYEMLYGITVAHTSAREPGDIRIPRLYVSTFSKRLVKVAIRFMPLLGHNPRRFGQNHDIDLVKIASWHVPATTVINVRRYLAVKEQASACHASQRPLDQSNNTLLRLLLERTQAVETFHRLYPFFRKGERIETDLFDSPLQPRQRAKTLRKATDEIPRAGLPTPAP